jgi:hypothetical protein
LSIDLVKKTFMEIEEPEKPIEFPVLEAARAPGPPTIGVFYAKIKQQIIALGDGAFSTTPRNQVTGGGIRLRVTNVTTASAAIDRIVVQGEGTTTSPLAGNDDPAHYYRFAEIYNGRKLRPDPSSPNGFSYSGDPIVLDPTGVYDVPTNPMATDYPSGSAVREACDAFNAAYTNLLIALHAVFNGHSTDLGDAIGAMDDLGSMAVDMMSGSMHVGPSFEWHPV